MATQEKRSEGIGPLDLNASNWLALESIVVRFCIWLIVIGSQRGNSMFCATIKSVTLSISLMLAVEDAPAAAEWYRAALGATELWSLGSVIGLDIDGAPFFLHEPTNQGFASPAVIGQTTVRVEVFVDEPDVFLKKAISAGAIGSVDDVRDHDVPWGHHRQGSFTDPFGHVWLIGDRSPLKRYSG
ncbi:MAG TPA: VOC family protein [Acidimicrobiales bacterium]|nr:VOC family protein [Acidimicrobiales bacterium]